MFIPNNAPPPKPPSLDPKTYWSRTYNFTTPPRPPPGPLTLTGRQPINPAHHLLWWSYAKLVWLSQNVPYYTKKLLWFCFWVCITALITFLVLVADTYLKNRFDPENAYRRFSTTFFSTTCLVARGVSDLQQKLYPNARGMSRTNLVCVATIVGSVILAFLVAARDGVDPKTIRFR